MKCELKKVNKIKDSEKSQPQNKNQRYSDHSFQILKCTMLSFFILELVFYFMKTYLEIPC